MACCVMAPSHYQKQYWLIISKVQWQSNEDTFTSDISHQLLKLAWKCLSRNLSKSSRGQWVNIENTNWVKVQFRGTKLYREIEEIIQEESYLSRFSRLSFLHWHTIYHIRVGGVGDKSTCCPGSRIAWALSLLLRNSSEAGWRHYVVTRSS